ncbi:MAG TPA: glycosyl hydrolase family 65 protein [Pelovirga sp.]|nr:glycosyl hydrolase family 65 protein [Pelovirga sp.]
MNNWTLTYENFEPEQQNLREALCTIGNGYFCTRGAAPEATADETHYPGTYLAGGYNRLKTAIADRTIENEDLVNFPNWLPLSFCIEGGAWFDLAGVDILEYHQQLDLKCGLLQRRIRFKDSEQRISTLSQRSLVHMSQRHIGALETSLTAENWEGLVEFRTALDGRVKNGNVERYRDLASEHLEPLMSEQSDPETILLKVRTNQSRLEMAQAARSRIFIDDKAQNPERQLIHQEGFVAQSFELQLQRSVKVRIEKVVAIFTHRDEAISECGREACKELKRSPDFEQLLKTHSLAWSHLWKHFNLELQGDDHMQQAQIITRLHIFHLLQTTSPHTIELDVGIPARGWHGEAYRGHIFWDELFIFPLLNLRFPEITRSLLKYRYRRLSEARAAARDSGYHGAMFPWQSGSNGREESQHVHLNPKSGNWIRDNSRLQRHVNAAIAWNVWQYYQVTGDMEFLSFYGAEMILEIARFWASMSRWNKDCERYEILAVMGPDEYHDAYPDSDRPGLDNNAYTNIMAVWTLTCAIKALDTISEERRNELYATLELDDTEISQWEDISRKMRVAFHGDGIISQFEGYEQLKELDWDSYHAKHGKVMRLDRILEAEGDTPNRYKCSKQADVLMLFYLFTSEELSEIFERLDYPFAYETIPTNIEYYIARTSHGSTLSQIVHSWVLTRSDREGSWKLFNQALHADVKDIQGGTTPEGIHLGAMAGTVDLLQRNYTGLEARADMLNFNPCLPRELDGLKLWIRYRGQSLEVTVTSRHLTVKCLKCGIAPVKICCCDKESIIEGGQTLSWDLKQWNN